jgi:hypothetical protein
VLWPASADSKSGAVYGSLGISQSYFSEIETVLSDFLTILTWKTSIIKI